MTRALILAQAASTLPLVGLIWTIQLVHYPLFDRVGEGTFSAYHAEHSMRITWIVLPLMLTELVAAGLLLAHIERPVTSTGAWVGLGLVGVIWLSTAFLQVPQHGALGSGFNASAHAFLVISNWVRTLAWSLRGALVLWWLAELTSPES